MKLENVVAFAKENGYDGAEVLGTWNGFDVWEPTFDGTDPVCVGLPLVILVNGDEMRMSTPEEAMDILEDMNE